MRDPPLPFWRSNHLCLPLPALFPRPRQSAGAKTRRAVKRDGNRLSLGSYASSSSSAFSKGGHHWTGQIGTKALSPRTDPKLSALAPPRDGPRPFRQETSNI